MFNIGDRVKYIGSIHRYKGTEGIIISIYPAIHHGIDEYRIEIGPGNTMLAYEDEIQKETPALPHGINMITEWGGLPVDTILDPHEGHEIVENYVRGNAFKYCKKCKIEVM